MRPSTTPEALLIALRAHIAAAGLAPLLFAQGEAGRLRVRAAGPGAEPELDVQVPATRTGLAQALRFVGRYSAAAQKLNFAAWRSAWNAPGDPR